MRMKLPETECSKKKNPNSRRHWEVVNDSIDSIDKPMLIMKIAECCLLNR